MSDAATRTLRTVVQTLVGLCVLLPSAASSSGLTATLPWAAGAVAAAGALSRLMSLPGVQALLPSWLRTGAPVNGDHALRALPDPAAAPASGSEAGFGFTAGAGSGTDPGSGTNPGSDGNPGSDDGPGEEGGGA